MEYLIYTQLHRIYLSLKSAIKREFLDINAYFCGAEGAVNYPPSMGVNPHQTFEGGIAPINFEILSIAPVKNLKCAPLGGYG